MWTLYDPLVRPEQSDRSTAERRRGSIDTRCNAPSSFEKVWFLIEPYKTLTRRISDAMKRD